MSELEQAARQALDALEDIFGKEKKDVGAINALREALENHESAYQRGYLDGMAKPCIDCADRKLQAMKQPKQEPVAWKCPDCGADQTFNHRGCKFINTTPKEKNT